MRAILSVCGVVYMSEIWLPISGCDICEGRYEVSDIGRIRSVGYEDRRGTWRNPRIMRTHLDTHGYVIISLTTVRGRNSFFVHRLVAKAFIEHSEDADFVLHLDGNILNNCASNLEWSSIDRPEFCLQNGRKTAKSKSKPVRQYTVDGKFVAEFPSAAEASRVLGVSSHSDISRVCVHAPGRITSGGFIWRFVEDDDLWRQL